LATAVSVTQPEAKLINFKLLIETDQYIVSITYSFARISFTISSKRGIGLELSSFSLLEDLRLGGTLKLYTGSDLTSTTATTTSHRLSKHLIG
jgi:hypothetical protein